MEHYLPYGISCHPTQVNALRLEFIHTGRYLIYRVFTWSSKRRALARVLWIHMLEVCSTFAGSCKHPVTYLGGMEDLSWWHIDHFLAPETGASHLVPETMTHFANKWYWQKQNKNEFRFWEFWEWWRYSCCFSTHVVQKIQKKSNLNESDGKKFNMFNLAPVSGTRKIWYQKSMAHWPVSGASRLLRETGARNWPVWHHH